MLPKKIHICENVTASVLRLTFAEFFSPNAVLSVKFIWRDLRGGHMTCCKGHPALLLGFSHSVKGLRRREPSRTLQHELTSLSES